MNKFNKRKFFGLGCGGLVASLASVFGSGIDKTVKDSIPNISNVKKYICLHDVTKRVHLSTEMVVKNNRFYLEDKRTLENYSQTAKLYVVYSGIKNFFVEEITWEELKSNYC